VKKPLNAFLGEIFEGEWNGLDGGEKKKALGWLGSADRE